jgi:hypothetical protein
MTEEEWARERATIIDEKVIEELPAPSTKRRPTGKEVLPMCYPDRHWISEMPIK